MAKMKVIDCFRLRSRPSALLGTVALRIPDATHPEPLGCELADKEEAGIVATGNSLTKREWMSTRKAVTGSRKSG